jgi:hypothetical protein
MPCTTGALPAMDGRTAYIHLHGTLSPPTHVLDAASAAAHLGANGAARPCTCPGMLPAYWLAGWLMKQLTYLCTVVAQETSPANGVWEQGALQAPWGISATLHLACMRMCCCAVRPVPQPPLSERF